MFDRMYFNKTTKEYNEIPKDITVKNYNAPTIESVKLLKELQDLALKNIILEGSTDNNGFSFKYLVTTVDIHNLQLQILIEFYINNRKYVKIKPIKRNYSLIEKKFSKNAIEDIYETISEMIKEVILDILKDNNDFNRDFQSIIEE